MFEKDGGKTNGLLPTRERSIVMYFDMLHQACINLRATDENGRAVSLDVACEWVADRARSAHLGGDRVLFIGNGGSSSIASHQAIDFTKNGNIRAVAFNDAAALTCLGNDLGYENVFSRQVEIHGRRGDLLIAISSSGKSPNIVNAVIAAKKMGMTIVTLSGFDPANPLQSHGALNFFVASREYGIVELSHLALLHAILDVLLIGAGGER